MDNTIATRLKAVLNSKDFVDVGKNACAALGCKESSLRDALKRLEAEGYNIHRVKFSQEGTDRVTVYKVLSKPDTSWTEAREAVHAGGLVPVDLLSRLEV